MTELSNGKYCLVIKFDWVGIVDSAREWDAVDLVGPVGAVGSSDQSSGNLPPAMLEQTEDVRRPMEPHRPSGSFNQSADGYRRYTLVRGTLQRGGPGLALVRPGAGPLRRHQSPPAQSLEDIVLDR